MVLYVRFFFFFFISPACVFFTYATYVLHLVFRSQLPSIASPERGFSSTISIITITGDHS